MDMGTFVLDEEWLYRIMYIHIYVHIHGYGYTFARTHKGFSYCLILVLLSQNTEMHLTVSDGLHDARKQHEV
jgi:hypothetical protein